MSHTIQIMQMGQIGQLENDKKELLGIIQGKDKEIERLKLNIQEDSTMFQHEINELKEKIETMKKFNPCGDWNDDVHACQMYIRQDELYELTHENEKLKQLLKQFVDKYTEVMFFGDENLFA